MDLTMEGMRRREDFQSPSSLASPRGWNCIHGSGHGHQHNQHQQPIKSSSSLLSITRSDQTNPYPTTFVQADTSNFKQVVQMLTGSSDTAKIASASASASPSPSSPKPLDSPRGNSHVIPPIKTAPPKRPQTTGFKLYERRQSNLKNSLSMINTLMINSRNNNTHMRGGISPSKAEIPSPSALDFTNLALSSPVTPLRNHGNSAEDPFNKSSPLSSLGSSSEEERAIAEKGFYLHPSPVSTPRDSEPQLLPLFPVSSPRVSSGSSS